MGFLKKLKKVIKKIDPIGSKIHEKTGAKIHAAASKAMGTGVLGKLSNLDPVTKAVRRSSLGNALRSMGELNPIPGMEAQPPPTAPPVTPVPATPPMAPVPTGQMAPPMAGPPPMGAAPPTPMGMAPGPTGGVMPPTGPMGTPMARGAALRGFGGGMGGGMRRAGRPGY